MDIDVYTFTYPSTQRERSHGRGAHGGCLHSSSAHEKVYPALQHTLDGGASHNGAESVDRARSELGSFGSASVPAALLAAGLVRALTSGQQAPLLSRD